MCYYSHSYSEGLYVIATLTLKKATQTVQCFTRLYQDYMDVFAIMWNFILSMFVSTRIHCMYVSTWKIEYILKILLTIIIFTQASGRLSSKLSQSSAALIDQRPVTAEDLDDVLKHLAKFNMGSSR